MPRIPAGPSAESHFQGPGHDLLPSDALAFAKLASRCTLPILLRGETGSGKTHLARIIHELSARGGRPFVRVNCASIPDPLFERELFGHVRGAFTDAREAGTGFVEAANLGTLFLDEFGELTSQVQPKLLALLEEGRYRKLGSPKEMSADLRFVFATNRDLPGMVQNNAFREDLYYRCSTLQFEVRPLRLRKAEFPGIIRGLLAKWSPVRGGGPGVSLPALAMLREHSWPGNFRELENVLRGALVYAEGDDIQCEHLRLTSHSSPARQTAVSTPRYATPSSEAEEANAIREALVLEDGRRGDTARRLGMSRATLWTKMQRYRALLDAPPREHAEPG